MVIQWYPGHMTKAKRAMLDDVKKVDLVIELLDARIPFSSRNPDIDELARGKYRLILLNKADLADEAVTAAWVRHFRESGLRAIALDARAKTARKQVETAITDICREKIEKDRKRGISGRRIKAMVAGIPNVGKSTVINSLAGHAAAKTGNLPGVTRGNQWIRVGTSVDLLDTPGILWPKFEDETVGTNLALVGSVNEEITIPEELAAELIKSLRQISPGAVSRRYGAEEGEPFDVLKAAAIQRSCFKKQSEPDTERMAKQLLNEFRSGKLGRISLEQPPVTDEAAHG